VHFFAGGTQDQYEASIAAVHPGEGRLPDGQTFHAAGASAGGWTILAVHESKASWELFRDSILLPGCSRASRVGSHRRPRDCHRRLQGLLLTVREAADGPKSCLPCDFVNVMYQLDHAHKSIRSDNLSHADLRVGRKEV
jgi:hypothetical protein